MATELQKLTRKAKTATAYAEAIEVHRAQVEWNQSHPDSKPLDLERWRSQAQRLGKILAKQLINEAIE